MTAIISPSVQLFSYGTLQDKQVQLASFGRELAGRPDSMPGYVLMLVAITDPRVVETSGKTHHPIARASTNLNDEVRGMVFEITPEELDHADQYEVADYKRIAVTLKSGLLAWAYVEARRPEVHYNAS